MSDTNLCSQLLKEYPYNDQTAFKEILQLQRQFSGRFTPYDELNKEGLRAKWTTEYLVCICDEVQEVMGWLPWKHWRHYPEDFKLELVELRFELIDIMHFMMDLGFVIEMDWSSFDFCRDMDRYIAQKNAAVGDESTGEYDIEAQTDATKDWMVRMYKGLGLIAQAATWGDWDSARKCYADLLATYYDGLALWDMDGETLNNYYRSKNAENIDRQNRGY